MSGSKLVENLAESLVNELSESKTLDLMNDQKFSEFTDLLWEILDRVDKAEDREKEKEEKEKQESENEKEVTDSVKALAEKITEYFGKGGDKGGSTDGKTDKILKIVQNLQNDDKESGESDDEKKKKKLTLGKKTKEQKELEETKEKKEEEKKEEEKAQLDKKTVQMLAKLSKDFEKSEKERKKQNSFVRKGLKRVERKIGSLLWKALNKFKGILLIGALIFFRKPIIKFFKGIWEKYLKPHVAPLIFKLGEKVGNLWEDIKKWLEGEFPELTDWIKNEYPKVKNWFKENWEKTKKWFLETFPQIQEALDAILDSWVVRHFKKEKIDEKRQEAQEKWQDAVKKYGYDSLQAKELEYQIEDLTYQYREADHQFKGEDKTALVNTGTGYQTVLTGGESYGKQELERLNTLKKQLEGYKRAGSKASEQVYSNMVNDKPFIGGSNFASDANNTNYLENGSVLGGMGGQYNASDVDSGKNTNLIDNSHQGTYIFAPTYSTVYHGLAPSENKFIQ